jgi:ABC-type cobalamin/Fe3+-siderophores transport system ATPase subunit
VVVGINGSGKSTMLNAIAGTVVLDEGVVRIAGQDVTHWPEHRPGGDDRPGVSEPFLRHRPSSDRRRKSRDRAAARAVAGDLSVGLE